jgi:hypothetical protein
MNAKPEKESGGTVRSLVPSVPKVGRIRDYSYPISHPKKQNPLNICGFSALKEVGSGSCFVTLLRHFLAFSTLSS